MTYSLNTFAVVTPEIEKTFDFAAYSAGVALKELGRCIKEAFGGTDKEVDDVCDSEH